MTDTPGEAINQARMEQERLRRWRLILGSNPSDPAPGEPSLETPLEGADLEMDRVLQALYESDRKGGLGSSSPRVNRWLGDIRRFFPSSVVRLMQKDALERLKLHEMLLQPETLETVEADVQLVATLLSLKQVIPEKTRETARTVVRRVVEEVQKRLRNRLLSAVRGALDHVSRHQRPRPRDIDWDRTIRKNLKHYLPDRQTLIPEQLVGRGRRQAALHDLILCVDQSGSMAPSVVYAGIFAAVMASLKSLRTQMIAFDTEIADLTEQLHDPIDLLFSTQLGGGTDINRAITYCQQRITNPSRTTLVLISDLFEGGDVHQLLRQTARLMGSGVNMICLLALSDDGTPACNHQLAASLASLGVSSFACTPDLFPDFIATALKREDLQLWAARNGMITQDVGRHSSIAPGEPGPNIFEPRT